MSMKHNFVPASRRAFTLVEMLVVASLIALLSGIALFAINDMYNNNIRKVTIGESHQLATALSIAQQDIQFYPRFNTLTRSIARISLNSAGNEYADPNAPGSTVLPGLDYYGFLNGSPPILPRIKTTWAGPYMGQSLSRDGSNRGNASGLVKVRLPDLIGVTVDGQDASIVDWPADVYGNPFLLYVLKSSIDQSGAGLLPKFIEHTWEEGDYLTAVVSYGRNGIPGKYNPNNPGVTEAQLRAGALYITGDPLVSGGTAKYTLKTWNATDPSVRLDNDPANPNYAGMLLTLGVLDPNVIGIKTSGSDDIALEF